MNKYKLIELIKDYQKSNLIENSTEASIREFKEESGLNKIYYCSESIFDIDIHAIPNSDFSSHFHYDIRILIIACDKEKINFDLEKSLNVKWFELKEVVKLSLDKSLLRMIDKSKTIILQI